MKKIGWLVESAACWSSNSSFSSGAEAEIVKLVSCRRYPELGIRKSGHTIGNSKKGKHPDWPNSPKWQVSGGGIKS